jgi:heptosyltransferase-1
MNLRKRFFDIKHILIIRPSSIGDIVMASPMLNALKNGYPKARITWLADPSAIDLLRFNPHLDEVIPWNKSKWKRLWKKGRLVSLLREILRFSREMRARHFDLAIDAQGLLRSRILAWLSGARERVGFESKEPGRFLMTRIISRGPSNKCMGAEYEHLMRELGIVPSEQLLPHLVLSPHQKSEGQTAIRKTGVSGKYSVFCAFTTRPQKHWVRDRWSILAKAVHQEFGLPVVLLGGPADRQEALLILSQAPNEIIDLTGKLPLAVGAAIISECALAIGVDTGLTHMAVSFGCPTVALFGATCPYLYSNNQRALVLYREIACSPCKRSPSCGGKYNCMESIRVRDVIEAAKSLIQP